MSKFFSLVVIFFLISCSENKKELEKEQNIELIYIAWACECANWATKKDIAKYQDFEDKLAEKCVFIEPTNDSVEIPDSLIRNNIRILFKGNFYKSKGFSNGFESKQNPEKAKVFRYYEYKIINNEK
ncbi:hypothetical protein [Flavobacterium sp.]|uniref:hypothetical protein n=1 Tax=Flavobacterium sp. TaxID=239 RepID=UPI0040482E3A